MEKERGPLIFPSLLCFYVYSLLLCIFFLKFNFYLFIYLWLCWVFVSVRGLSPVWQVGATLHRGARASHYHGAQAPDAQAQ